MFGIVLALFMILFLSLAVVGIGLLGAGADPAAVSDVVATLTEVAVSLATILVVVAVFGVIVLILLTR